MGQYNSPGVFVQETVQQAQSPSFSTSSAALVGPSLKGRLDCALFTNPLQFLTEYTLAGQVPLGSNFHYSALAYLTQGTQLYVQRVISQVSTGGTPPTYPGARIKISTSVQANLALASGAASTAFVPVSGNQDCFEIFAKDPGAWGNNIAVEINNINPTLNTFEIDVYLYNPYTGIVSSSPVESWTVSRAYQLNGYGIQQYLMTAINGFSQYIVVADNLAYAPTVLPKGQGTLLYLGVGTDGTVANDADIAQQWAQFTNEQNFDVALLISGGNFGPLTQAAIQAVVDSRKDCLGLMDTPNLSFSGSVAIPSSTVATNVVSFRQGSLGGYTSTAFNDQRLVMCSPWVKISDQWNNQIVYVPASGYIAAQIAYNDYVADVSNSPMGFNRGVLPVLGVATVYQQGDRDTLYEAQVNPIQLFRASGTVLYGDKTLTTTPGIFSRINTRRNIDFAEKALSIILQNYLGENNIPVTQAKVTSDITTYLAGRAAAGAWNPIGPNGTNDKGYAVVCNATNNTPAVVSANQLVVTVYLRPAQSINFIVLQANILDSSVSIQTLTSNGTLI